MKLEDLGMSSRTSARAAGVVLLGGLLASLAGGCKQAVLCPALGECGGTFEQLIGPPRTNPDGTPALRQQEWVLAPNHPSCTEDLYLPATDTRLFMGNIPTTQMPFPEPAVFDWCLLLVTGPSAPGQNIRVTPPRFYYESGEVGAASVKYDEMGHFSAGTTRTGKFYLDFPSFCVRAFGAKDGDPIDPVNDPMGPTGPLCKQLEVPVAQSGLGEGSYRNTKCDPSPADPGGCVCSFEVTETGGPSGHFQLLDGNTIMHLPGSNFPQKATFCVQGDTLQLTGANGAYLFDQRGLRTFDLVKACNVDTECASGFCFHDPNNTDLHYCAPRPQ